MSAREYVESRLDAPYVAQTARWVADALHRRVPIEACFQPGDGTRYVIAFVPVISLESTPGRVASMRCTDCRGTGGKLNSIPEETCPACQGSGRTEEQEWVRHCQFGVERALGRALVVWPEHGGVALDLSGGGFVGVYVAGLFNCTEGSGHALAHLFNLVGEAF